MTIIIIRDSESGSFYVITVCECGTILCIEATTTIDYLLLYSICHIINHTDNPMTHFVSNPATNNNQQKQEKKKIKKKHTMQSHSINRS